jgi:hypothetical protein
MNWHSVPLHPRFHPPVVCGSQSCLTCTKCACTTHVFDPSTCSLMGLCPCADTGDGPGQHARLLSDRRGGPEAVGGGAKAGGGWTDPPATRH